GAGELVDRVRVREVEHVEVPAQFVLRDSDVAVPPGLRVHEGRQRRQRELRAREGERDTEQQEHGGRAGETVETERIHGGTPSAAGGCRTADLWAPRIRQGRGRKGRRSRDGRGGSPGRTPGLPPRRDGRLGPAPSHGHGRALQVLLGVVPVHERVEEGRRVVRPAVLIVEVV